MLLLAFPTIALPLGTKLLAHSVCIHDIYPQEYATRVRGNELSDFPGVVQCDGRELKLY